MSDRLSAYAAALVCDWLSARDGQPYALERAVEGEAPVFIASGAERPIAVAIATLWEPERDPAADAARKAMEDRLNAGEVRGPYIVWVPPRAAVPSEEPAASDFVMRVQMAAAPMQPGSRNEIDLPATIQLAKLRDEGGYASVTGALSRFWTLITERVEGTFHVNGARIRRAPKDEAVRTALFDRIGELSKGLSTGDAIEFDAVEAWTLQRLRSEPLGERGFAIAQAPPGIDPSDGTVMRRLVRKRLQQCTEALAGVEAGVKGAALLAIYEYAEHENVGSFVKSLDPRLFTGLGFLASVVDGDVQPVLQQRG